MFLGGGLGFLAHDLSKWDNQIPIWHLVRNSSKFQLYIIILKLVEQ